MTTSIRLSDETKHKLACLKPDDKTRDEFFGRLIDDVDPVTIGAWSATDAERARQATDESRQSFEQNGLETKQR